MSEYCVVLVTCPDRETGVKIASALVEENLAACANLVEGVTSIYRWEGRIEQDAEVLLVIKTPKAMFDALETRVKSLHPYDVPEVIALPIEAGSKKYLDWITQNT